MKDTSAKYGCDKYIAYRHKVTSATWSEPSGKWILTVDADGKELTDSCDVLINAGGVLK
jgi:cation diffusion facilitator CzcD-associated flavoprotein CzcO